MTNSEAEELVRKAVSALGEHFDSVRCFVTWPSDDGQQNTKSYESGTGNFYAQYGQIKEWCAMQDEYQRIHARKVSDSKEDEE